MSELEKKISYLETALLRERRARRFLENALNTLEEGFVLYDEEDRLVFSNSKVKELYELTADFIIPGIPFEDLMKTAVQRGEYSEALGREEEFVQDRLEKHKKADCTFEQELTNGRWVRVSDRKTIDGGTAGIRLDITELKQHQHFLAGQNHYLAALQEMSQALEGRDGWETLLNSIVQRTCLLTGAGSGFLYLYNEEADELEMAVTYGGFAKSKGFRLKNGQGLAGRAVVQQKVMFVDDYSSWDKTVGDGLFRNLHACVVVPLGKGKGALGLGHFNDNMAVFEKNDIDILSRFAAIASIVLENSILYSKLKQELAQRELTEKALQASNDYHRSLFDESPIALSIQDFSQVKARVQELRAAGVTDLRSYLQQNHDELAGLVASIRMLRVNQAAINVYKAHSSKELAISVDKLTLSHSWGHVIDQIVAFMDGETRYDGEALNQTLEGDILNVIIRKSVIPGYEHDLSRVLVATTDLTALYKAISIKEKLENQLQQAQKMEAIGTLAGGIAHDFNNILAMIMGFGDLAQKKAALGIDNAEDIGQIVKAAERARNLVRQILTYSRKSETEMKVLDLNQVVLDSVKLLKHTLPKMIKMELNLAPDLDCVLADPAQMEQVIVNLANNAGDAMPDGGRLIFETACLSLGDRSSANFPDMSPGRYLLLMVTDTGPGMDKETIGRVFDPFFTTKEIGKGTGLGLSTVYGIVREHGGRITCYSEPGLGTTFKIYLPADSSDPVAQEIAPRPGQEELSGVETILMVDDEEAIRRMVSDFLEQLGYQVICAANGEEALKKYNRNRDQVDLVILDLGMPGMGGNKCLKKLLALNPDLKVLIASGYSANGKVADTINEGAAEYLAKPFRLGNLQAKVRKVLDA